MKVAELALGSTDLNLPKACPLCAKKQKMLQSITPGRRGVMEQQSFQPKNHTKKTLKTLENMAQGHWDLQSPITAVYILTYVILLHV